MLTKREIRDLLKRDNDFTYCSQCNRVIYFVENLSELGCPLCNQRIETESLKKRIEQLEYQINHISGFFSYASLPSDE